MMLAVVSEGLGCRHPLPEKSRERLQARPIKMRGGRWGKGGRMRLANCSGLKALSWLHKESCWCKP